MRDLNRLFVVGCRPTTGSAMQLRRLSAHIADMADAFWTAARIQDCRSECPVGLTSLPVDGWIGQSIFVTGASSKTMWISWSDSSVKIFSLFEKMKLLGFAGKSRRQVEPDQNRPLSFAALEKSYQKYLAPLDSDQLKIQSMIGLNERSFLFHLARDYYIGEGIILDGGIFLGASTYAFASGVRDNKRSRDILSTYPKPVISLDRAIMTNSFVKAFARHGIGKKLALGDSFEDIIRENIADVISFVDLRIGDILNRGLVDQPIEILFLDVLKSPEINAFALRNYFTRLIPGRSIVIHQDYFMDGLFFIRSHQEALADKFRYIGELSSSGVFLCKEAVSIDDVDAAIEKSKNLDAMLNFMDIASARSLDPHRRILMLISKMRLLANRRKYDAARDSMAKVEDLIEEVGEHTFTPRLRRSVAAARHICASDFSAEALTQYFDTAYNPPEPNPQSAPIPAGGPQGGRRI